MAIVRHVIPVALIHHWLLLHWPSVAGPAVGVLGILIAVVAHRRPPGRSPNARPGRAGRCRRPRPQARAAPARAGIMWAMPYAYLGPEGTFSEAALRAVDSGAEPLSCPTIQAALAAVRDGTADRAVVPIESSVEGVVTATLDDLAAGNL